MDPFLKELQDHLFDTRLEIWKEWRTLHGTPSSKSTPPVKIISGLITHFESLHEDLKKAELTDLSQFFLEIQQAFKDPKILDLKIQRKEVEDFLNLLEQEFASWKLESEREKILNHMATWRSSRPWHPQTFLKRISNPFSTEWLYLKLQISNANFLIPMNAVIEISNKRPIVELPDASPGTLGLLTLRGEMLPILSIENLCAGERLPNPYNFLVIGTYRGQTFGIPASQTDNVIRVDENLIQASSDWVSPSHFKTVLLDNSIYQIINLEKLIA